MILDDSDDGIEEEMREVETLETSMNEISKPLDEVTGNDWVLGCHSEKKFKRYYVAQIKRVVNIEYDDDEIKFTREVSTLDPSSSRTINWKWFEEYAFVPREDIILSLPTPYFGRRCFIIKLKKIEYTFKFRILLVIAFINPSGESLQPL